MRARTSKYAQLITCVVCSKERQINSFFQEHNPKGKKLTCKYCSFEGKVYCPICATVHEKSAMASAIFQIGEVCPIAAPSLAPKEPVMGLPAIRNLSGRVFYSEILSLIAAAMERMADRLDKVELQNSMITDSLLQVPSPKPEENTQMSDLQSKLRNLEHREKEALELFYVADEAKKQLEAKVSDLQQILKDREAAIEERDRALASLSEGRESLVQALSRMQEHFKA